ncbi:MAG: 4Fe-4S dicluster domain-containing protein [Pseudomonadota bacterium]
MIDLSGIAATLREHGLAIVGGVSRDKGSDLPPSVSTLLLIGADGDQMWEVFSASPEAADGAPDPLDRWSERVLNASADASGAHVFFPFGGPPHHPFFSWAMQAEHARPSPICLLVSPTRGLWTSYRGALGFERPVALPAMPMEDPCLDCPAPCVTACPVNAFAGQAYDVAACVTHISGPDGAGCEGGCLARHACPRGAHPPLAQRQFHMNAFVASRRHRV